MEKKQAENKMKNPAEEGEERADERIKQSDDVTVRARLFKEIPVSHAFRLMAQFLIVTNVFVQHFREN